MEPLRLPMLPGDCAWKETPVDFSLTPDSTLSITAGPRSDWFTNPGGGPPSRNAPAALFTPPDETFLLSAQVTVDFNFTYDAGVLFCYVNDDLWAKLCFEYSPQGQPMVVSVVTRGASDDCNSTPIDGRTVYLRVARGPRTLAFHYSLDGQLWHFVRYFTLGEMPGLQVGFLAQSPTGEHCRATFANINYRAGALSDLRSGV